MESQRMHTEDQQTTVEPQQLIAYRFQYLGSQTSINRYDHGLMAAAQNPDPKSLCSYFVSHVTEWNPFAPRSPYISAFLGPALEDWHRMLGTMDWFLTQQRELQHHTHIHLLKITWMGDSELTIRTSDTARELERAGWPKMNLKFTAEHEILFLESVDSPHVEFIWKDAASHLLTHGCAHSEQDRRMARELQQKLEGYQIADEKPKYQCRVCSPQPPSSLILPKKRIGNRNGSLSTSVDQGVPRKTDQEVVAFV